MPKRNVCPNCGAPVQNVNTLVTYIATLTEDENGDLLIDQLDEKIEVNYRNEPTFYCTECEHEFAEFKVIEEEE